MAQTITVDSKGRTSANQALKEQMAHLDAEAKQNWDNPKWRLETAAVITQEILSGFDHENVLDLFADVRNVAEDDVITIGETKGLRAFWTAADGYIETSQLSSEVTTMDYDNVGFHVYDFEDNIINKFSETQATIINLGIRRLDAAINQRFLKIVQAATITGNGNYTLNAGTTLAAVNSALSRVRDASDNPDQVIIAGRQASIDQVYAQLLGTGSGGTNFLPETNEALIQQGSVGRYRGAAMIPLKNYKDDYGKSFVPANELYIIAPDAAIVGFWGGLKAIEDTDANWRWSYKARRKVGYFVHHPDRLHRIVDSNIAA